MSFVTGSAYSSMLQISDFEIRNSNCFLTPQSAIRNSKFLTQQSTQPWGQHAAKFTLHCFVYFAISFVDRGEDHVLEHLDIALFDSFRIDLQRHDFMIAFHLHCDNAAAC